MKPRTHLFTNEIVFRGHPDKVCDQISMALLQTYLSKDPNTKAGIEVLGSGNKLVIAGEVRSKARIAVRQVIRRILYDIGYDPETFVISNNLTTQSPDIAMGVDRGGAGDNGMVFGYACDDTEELLPTAMVILQKFAKEYDNILHSGDRRFLPDGKAQITGEYNKHNKLVKIKTFTICYQNTEMYREDTDDLLKHIARRICSEYDIKIDRFLVNPTGRFECGGFMADAGLTGRKIVVDTYQSFAKVGGGCMNGKDWTKVDFSGAHYARLLAKHILKKKGLKWCEVQMGFAIGINRPLSVLINSNKGLIDYPVFTDINTMIQTVKEQVGDLVELAKFGHFSK